MKLIIGLGNPEKQYVWTRHNLGFLVLAALAEKDDLKYKKSALTQAIETKIIVKGEACSLMMPMTYMNHSGLAVKQWVDKKGLASSDILIVCDDLSLSFGQIRLRSTGSSGGHNGIKSVIEHLKTKDFARLRLGISQPPVSVDTADYVLSNFTTGEKKLLPDFINEAVACVTSWMAHGTKFTMNQFNQKRKDE